MSERKASKRMRPLFSKGREVPQKITAFYDTETRPVAEGSLYQELFLGCYEVWTNDGYGVLDKRIHVGSFERAEEFVSLIEELGEVRIVAHNADYDTNLIFKALSEKYRLDIEDGKSIVPIKEMAPFLFSLTHKENGSEIILDDNMNHWKTSVEKLGESFGVPKLFMPDWDAPMEEWARYCERDVEVLRLSWDSVSKFCRDEFDVVRGLTVSQTAMRVFKRKFLRSDVFIRGSKQLPEVSLVEEKAYMGGLTNCFYKGRSDKLIYQYDVNSSYPASMLEDMPVKYAGLVSKPLNGHLHLRRCVMDVPEDHPYSPLGGPPMRAVQDKYEKLICPAGQYVAYLWEPEFEIYDEVGWVRRVDKIWAYEKSALFRSFSKYMYEKKRKSKANGDGPREAFYKLMLNSLYGKTGQRVSKQFKKLDYDYWMAEGRTREKVESGVDDQGREYSKWVFDIMGEAYEMDDVKGEPSDMSVMSIAGFVTSSARARLVRGMRDAIDNGGRVYYCDTDSVFSDVRLSPDLVDGFELGKWGLDGESKDCEFVCPKQYSFGDKFKCKGVGSKQVKEARRVTGDFRYRTAEGFRGSIIAADLSRRERAMDGLALWKEVNKTVVGKNDKRIGEAGFNRPLRLYLPQESDKWDYVLSDMALSHENGITSLGPVPAESPYS